ncbi:hypothetical protein MFLAVUS_009425 [Mucor flavus]|uniref:Uncharacterized protein n=1 Tax=Mucor flavus TaxID=439312 RepID=A0ABP9Z9U7_9FUNG
MQFFYEDGTGNIINDRPQQAPTSVEESSFRLKSLAELRKCIKNKDVQLEVTAPNDTVMVKVAPKKEQARKYNVYTIGDQKLMKPKEAAKAANDATATIQDAVDSLTASFTGL